MYTCESWKSVYFFLSGVVEGISGQTQTQFMVFSNLRPLTQKAATQPQVLPTAQLRKGAEVALEAFRGEPGGEVARA